MSSLLVSIDDEFLRVSRGTRRATQVLLERPWSGAAGFRDDLASLPGMLAERNARHAADIVLDGHHVQRRCLKGLPPVSSRHVTSLVVAQQGKYFRAQRGALVIAARREGPDVRAAAVEAALLESLSEGLAEVGVRLREVRCARSGLRFRPPSLDARRLTMQRRRTRLMLAVNLLLWSAVPFTHLLHLHLRERRVVAALEARAGAAAALRDARRALDAAGEQVEALRSVNAHRDAVGRAMATLAQALPESSYASTLVLDQDGRGALSGSARSASAVVAALERAAWPQPVALDGDPTSEGRGGWERFSIRLGSRTRP